MGPMKDANYGGIIGMVRDRKGLHGQDIVRKEKIRQ